MLSYIKFMFTGGVLGLISWTIQYLISIFLINRVDSYSCQFISVIFTFIIVSILGFFAHSRIVFKSHGSIFRFYVVGILNILTIAVLTTIITFLVSQLNVELVVFAYPVAAILLSPLIFYIKKNIVYNVERMEE